MSKAGVRVGVGTSFRYDGKTVAVVEMAATTAGNEVVLKDGRGRLLRLSLKELLFSDRAAINPDGPGPSADDEGELASVVLRNRAMLEFFGHPGQTRGITAQFGRRVLDCVLSCDVRLVVLDDLHFLKWRQKSGIEVSNHLKWIANEFPVTLLMVGVELAKKGLFWEGTNGRDTALAQTGRRTARLGLRPFTIDAEAGRREWRQMLLALEQRVVLSDKHPGMLADDLSDYLFARSTGHIGSLMTLIHRSCQRAVRTGAECLDQELMDRVKDDEASEAARLELQAALEKKRLTSRPRPRSRRPA